MLREHLEIPYIRRYRQEDWKEVPFVLNPKDLWTIYDWDQKYHHWRLRFDKLQQVKFYAVVTSTHQHINTSTH